MESKQFPHGLGQLSDAAKQGSAGLGIWLSPWGGYGDNAAHRVKAAKANVDYRLILTGFALADHRYLALVQSVCSDFIRAGVNIFKFDGVLASECGECEAIQQLCAALRTVDPDVFCLTSSGTWGSPFFLLSSDCVWRVATATAAGTAGDETPAMDHISRLDRL